MPSCWAVVVAEAVSVGLREAVAVAVARAVAVFRLAGAGLTASPTPPGFIRAMAATPKATTASRKSAPYLTHSCRVMLGRPPFLVTGTSYRRHCAVDGEAHKGPEWCPHPLHELCPELTQSPDERLEAEPKGGVGGKLVAV
jgi:hypothetical protein